MEKVTKRMSVLYRNSLRKYNSLLNVRHYSSKKPFNFKEWAYERRAKIVVVGAVNLLLFVAIINPRSAIDGNNVEVSAVLASPQGEITKRVFFDIGFDNSPTTERVTIGLYGNDCPLTVDNFSSICAGNATNNSSNQKLSYMGSIFHRVIPSFMIQGGDITKGDGTGGASIYGGQFKDEPFKFKHNGLGVVSMANRGKDTNTSQFFICLAPARWLDGKHVVFGQVLDGISTLKKIESRGNQRGTVSGKVEIVRSGILPK